MASKYRMNAESNIQEMSPLVRSDDKDTNGECHGSVSMGLFRTSRSFVSFNLTPSPGLASYYNQTLQ